MQLISSEETNHAARRANEAPFAPFMDAIQPMTSDK